MKLLKKSQIVYLAPRIASLLFVLFLSLFALDVFGEYSGWEIIVALLIHLIPSIVLLLVIIIAWRHDLVGAIAFFAFAVFYVLAVGFDRHWSWYAGISGPLTFVGLLFLLSWRKKKR
jgi:hypothetical protein